MEVQIAVRCGERSAEGGGGGSGGGGGEVVEVVEVVVKDSEVKVVNVVRV